MKKQLTALAVIGCMMTATAQAFVPLSNGQINLGSFRSNATRGMFYTELDIFSASPVEIGDTQGNYLYTNWSNLRTNSNLNTGAAGPIAPGAATYDAPLGYNVGGGLGGRFLTLGMSGRPLWFLPVVKDIRAGAAFQNSGAKAGRANLDGSAPATFDLEWKRNSDNYTITFGTNALVTRTFHRETDLKNYTDTLNTQWNAGVAWPEFILKDFDIGASFSQIATSSRLTTGGKKTYSDTRNDDQIHTIPGLPYIGGGTQIPVGTREIATYSATFDTNSGEDQNSFSQTDVLAQARLRFLPFLTSVSGAAGVRLASNKNPGIGLMTDLGAPIGTPAAPAPFERNGLTLSLRDLILVGGNPNYVTRDTIRSRTSVPALNYGALDPHVAGDFTGGVLGAAPFAAGDPATTDFKDSRTGAGPLVRLEVMKKFDTVNVSALGNFSTVKQTIGAAQTVRVYSKITTPVVGGNSEQVVTDYTQSRAWTGAQTIANLDGGGKVEFTAMEGVRLALGGFLSRTNYTGEITDGTFTSTENSSFNDGVSGNGNSAAVFTPAVRPVALEGTWSQAITRKATSKTDSTVTQISVPVGVEIPLSKKWTFRAGTRYVMQKAKATVTTTITDTKAVTTVANTDNGGLQGPTTTWTTQDNNPVTTTVETFPDGGVVASVSPNTASVGPALAAGAPETHYMEYSYGIQFDPTKSLSLAANAFLDTNPGNPTIPGVSTGRSASILDLNTYRLLAIQAVFKF